MNSTRNCLKLSAVMLACAGALVGCGGGGSSTTATTNGGTTTTTTGAANYVTSVPAANYTGEAAAAYALLNNERQNCGFGLLAQSAALDKAATAHADYLLWNLTLGHSETVGLKGFTGATTNDRAVAAGYGSSYASEVAWSPTILPGIGVQGVRVFLSTPYHGATTLSGFHDVGFGIRSSAELVNHPGNMGAYVINFGYLRTMQDMAAGDVRLYPCAGSTGVLPVFPGESPNPLPGRDLRSRPAGHPLMVFGRQSTPVAITSASLINVATGAAVPLMAPVTSANDPNRAVMQHWSYVFPDVALTPNTQYQATLAGTSNGVAFSRTFAFTTGTNP